MLVGPVEELVEGVQSGLQQFGVVGLAGEPEFHKMQRGFQFARLQALPGLCGQRFGAAGERGEVGIELTNLDRVEVGGGFEVKPGAVVLPDAAHVPGHLAVALAQGQFRR